MIPATDPRTAAFPHRAPSVPFAQAPTRHGEPPPSFDHVAQLSAMVDYLLALQEHHGDDRRLRRRAGEAAARLRALAQSLQAATTSEVTRCSGRQGDATEPAPETADRGELEAAFQRWLVEPLAADEVHLDGRGPSPRALGEVLEVLCTSRRPLSDPAAAMLGMPAGTTISQAARELQHAVEDPTGPRCRSYRAAVYYLQGLSRIALAVSDGAEALR